jgi:hypothetical protein
MGAIIFGGFFLVVGLVGIGTAAAEGVGWLRRKRDADIGAAIVSLGFAVVFIPLGYLAIRYRGVNWTLGPTGERVALGLLGLVLLVAAVVVWILAPRVGEESGDFASDVISEGPAEAVSNAVWRTLGPRASGVVLAVIGAFAVSGFVWPAIPKQLFAAWLVAVDAIELFGYGLLMLLLVGFAIAGLARGRGDDVGFSLFFLALWGVGIGLGLAFGILDGWIDIVRWLGGLVG